MHASTAREKKNVKHNTISLRRRHLMIAGLAGAAAPAALFAQPLDLLESAGPGGKKLVVSGRIVTPDGKPVAGALVEVWQADASGEQARATTDGDGRFFTSIASVRPGRLPNVHYRVSHEAHATTMTQLQFSGKRGDAGRVAHVQRDEAGMWRASFGLTLA
jgi:protocatechuate 3,4-dioxygenase beta subunit